MSTISKERLEQLASGNAWVCVQDDEAAELARIALASLEAEPVGEVSEQRDGLVMDGMVDLGGASTHRIIKGASKMKRLPLGTKFYTAPPAPVSMKDHQVRELVNELRDISVEYHGTQQLRERIARTVRAAMLQGADGNSPVIPDDVRRMDWLVSKTVDVREPMVYGSHSLFWSQTITDEEDDYHATKLREQIDAAMEAEQAAAPQQEA
ncbi:hypothetical protein [Enterobacter kobei]|uniref:hypothetical protein n=1 Tax=Enterobacter kobei TaxID=208224 RepID=UPI002DB6FAC1|nr:hypothetical protein [Enterobacter kobei]MEB7605328.1 hypothetical protein [Enterobacter kobei]